MGPPGGTRSRKTATYPRTPQRHGMGSSHGHANPSLSHPRFSSLSLSAAFREADPQPTLSLPRMVAFVSPVSASSSRMRRPRSARRSFSMFFTFRKGCRTIVFCFPKITYRKSIKRHVTLFKTTRKNVTQRRQSHCLSGSSFDVPDFGEDALPPAVEANPSFRPLLHGESAKDTRGKPDLPCVNAL